MNNALTADDVSDLNAVAEGARNRDGSRRNLRASELDDGGAKLIGLGLVKRVARAAAYLAMTDAGLDELFERERAARLRQAAHARLAA